MAVWSITRCQKSPKPSVYGLMGVVGAPPKQKEGCRLHPVVDIVQSHYKDVQSPLKAKCLPRLRIELGVCLPVKKSKTRGRHRKDSGCRADARLLDVESSVQEERKLRSGT